MGLRAHHSKAYAPPIDLVGLCGAGPGLDGWLPGRSWSCPAAVASRLSRTCPDRLLVPSIRCPPLSFPSQAPANSPRLPILHTPKLSDVRSPRLSGTSLDHANGGPEGLWKHHAITRRGVKRVVVNLWNPNTVCRRRPRQESAGEDAPPGALEEQAGRSLEGGIGRADIPGCQG